jgi:hypothetical protein
MTSLLMNPFQCTPIYRALAFRNCDEELKTPDPKPVHKSEGKVGVLCGRGSF